MLSLYASDDETRLASLIPVQQQFWPVEHHGLESTLQLAVNRTLDLPGHDRLVLLAVAVLVCTFTTGVSSEVTLSPKLSTNPLPETPIGLADYGRNSR